MFPSQHAAERSWPGASRGEDTAGLVLFSVQMHHYEVKRFHGASVHQEVFQPSAVQSAGTQLHSDITTPRLSQDSLKNSV